MIKNKSRYVFITLVALLLTLVPASHKGNKAEAAAVAARGTFQVAVMCEHYGCARTSPQIAGIQKGIVFDDYGYCDSEGYRINLNKAYWYERWGDFISSLYVSGVKGCSTVTITKNNWSLPRLSWKYYGGAVNAPLIIAPDLKRTSWNDDVYDIKFTNPSRPANKLITDQMRTGRIVDVTSSVGPAK